MWHNRASVKLIVSAYVLQGAAVSDTEVEEKTSDDPHKLLDINLDEYVQLSVLLCYNNNNNNNNDIYTAHFSKRLKCA